MALPRADVTLPSSDGHRGATLVARRPSARQRVAAIAAVFLGLLVWRWEVLRLPPYWDAAMGLWTEASHLADTRLNYWHHWFHELNFLEGGNSNYRTSLVPGSLALAMLLLRPAWVILLGHLATLACAAVTIYLVYEMLSARFERRWAGLAALALATSPLYSTQFDLLGLEIPLSCAAVLTQHYLAQGSPRSAVGASLAAWLVKPTGSLVTAALLACLVGQQVTGSAAQEPARRRDTRTALVAAAALFALQWALLALLDRRTLGRFYSSNLQVFTLMPLWFPDLVVIGVVSFAGWLAIGPGLARRPEENSHAPAGWLARGYEAVAGLLANRPGDVFGLLLLVGTVLACTRVPTLPRYFAFVVPALFLALAPVLVARRSWRTGAYAAWAAIVAFNVANFRGQLLPSPETVSLAMYGERSQILNQEGSLLECSRAYLPSHLSNLAAVRALAGSADGDPVLTGAPWSFFVSLPRLGYVERPIEGYLADGAPDQMGRLASVGKLLSDLPERLVIVDGTTSMRRYFNSFERPEREPGDEILFVDDQSPPLAIVRHRLPVDRELRRRWLADRLWPAPKPYDPEPTTLEGIARFRARRLVEAGYPSVALDQTRDFAAEHPDRPELLQYLRELERATSQTSERPAAGPGLRVEHGLRGSPLAAPGGTP